MRGNCYVTSEALYHLLGGKDAGWKPMVMHWEGDTHWFLVNFMTGQRVDATASQFDKRPSDADYALAKGCGFLTREPSRRAQHLMMKMVWRDEEGR